MSNYFEHEYKLDPLVEGMFHAFEQQNGPCITPYKNSADLEDFVNAATAAAIIWAILNCKGSQIMAAKKLGINRNTLRKHIVNNKYLQPVVDSGFLVCKKYTYPAYELKCKMGLNRNG
jgi:DNA-binding protein Fis